MAEDRRSSGTTIERPEHRVESEPSHQREVRRQKYANQIHIDAISFDRFVLLVGEVPNQEIEDDV